jgi:anti-anti-sigma factor
MKLEKHNTNGFCIINIDGRIDTSNFNVFEKEISEIIESGESNIVLNCNKLNYISSSGLRVFLIAQKKLMVLKGKLQLCEMQATIKEIFDISGFSSIFTIVETEELATKA